MAREGEGAYLLDSEVSVCMVEIEEEGGEVVKKKYGGDETVLSYDIPTRRELWKLV